MDHDSQASRPTVLFIPMAGSENPYQQQLADHLRQPGQGSSTSGATGYNVIPIGQSTNLLKSVIGHWKPAVVHLHWLHPFVRSTGTVRSTIKVAALVGQLALLRILRIRIVWTVHNLHDHENLTPILDRFLNWSVSRLAHRLIVHGETAKRLVREAYGLRNDRKIAVIPHGNYCQWYPQTTTGQAAREKLGLAESQFVFLLLGNLRPYKGVTELIESFKEIDSEKTTLVIAGKPLTDQFGQEISAAVEGQKNILYHAGFVDGDEIQDYLLASDVVVFPYRDILTSGAIVLAMSFGRACIACRQGGVQDVLSEDRAFLYEPDDDRGLISTMRTAIDQQQRLAEFGKLNLEVARRWSWDSVAELTRATYIS